ncbi:PspC domain-containing protein [Terribacillus sp. DMT04]|uniref:PspC domain-containing protein n=1 Tax=Terribacillus sp. DMT04 TaxID=2850441 RepID=UPI001C2BCC29|nr:PspC domain-containing protein [Terribacillus sp. DMT04]QXE00635.1 PspC domain-containing protein [Terribacillus sp. DMT04]
MRKLFKSTTDKTLYGVCGGIAEFFGIPSLIVRLLFIFTSSVSIWVYLFLVWSLDEKPTLLR